MKQIVTDISDQLFELGQSTKKAIIDDIVKGIPQTAKQQISGSQDQVQEQVQDENKVNKINKFSKKKQTNDPITGKPVPSKKALTQLQDATAKLSLTKLQKVREELEKQRMKTSSQSKSKNPDGSGPEVKVEEKKPDPGAVARTLQQSQSTGEFKGSVGG